MASTLKQNHNPLASGKNQDFEAKYIQLNKIREGAFGSVYAGARITDDLPVNKIPLERALMQRVSGGPESLGKCAAVSLLDWYYLDKKLILVMERPDPSMDLLKYLQAQGGSLEENEAKITQLVEAAIEMHGRGVFLRDIKCENILVDVGSRFPHVRMINFGCGRFVKEDPNCTSRDWHMPREYKAAPTTVWQLGALLYCLVHGSKFSTLNFLNSLISSSRKLSQDCRDFFQLCLAINPNKRGTLQQLQLHPWLKYN